MSDPTKQPDDAVNSNPTDGDSRRRRSSDELTAVAPSPKLTPVDPADAIPVEDSRPPSSISSETAASLPAIPQTDDLLSEFDLMLDEEVAFRYGKFLHTNLLPSFLNGCTNLNYVL